MHKNTNFFQKINKKFKILKIFNKFSEILLILAKIKITLILSSLFFYWCGNFSIEIFI